MLGLSSDSVLHLSVARGIMLSYETSLLLQLLLQYVGCQDTMGNLCTEVEWWLQAGGTTHVPNNASLDAKTKTTRLSPGMRLGRRECLEWEGAHCISRIDPSG